MIRREAFLGVTVVLVVCLSLFSWSFATERLRITDGSGKGVFSVSDDGTVLVGTDSSDAGAIYKLYVAGDAMTGMCLQAHETGGAGGLFRFSRGTKTSKSAVMNGDRLGFFVFSGYDGSAFRNSVGFTAKVDGAVSPGVVPAKLVFETSTTGYPRYERMVITSAGRVGVGQSAPTHLFQVANAYCDGGAWVSGSSRSVKDNIRELTAREAKEALEGLRPIEFNYLQNQAEKHLGFVAEEVPELVSTNDRKGVSSMDIVAVLAKVVQEQQETISKLAGKLAALEQRMAPAAGL